MCMPSVCVSYVVTWLELYLTESNLKIWVTRRSESVMNSLMNYMTERIAERAMRTLFGDSSQMNIIRIVLVNKAHKC